MKVATVIPIFGLFVAQGCAGRQFTNPSVATAHALDIQPLIDQARDLHRWSEFAEQYPLLRRACPSDDGRRYEVIFGRSSSRGRAGITYYFDGQGSYLDWVKIHHE